MREYDEVELLPNVDIFESLSKEEIREILHKNSEVSLQEGEVFYAPGHTAASYLSSRRAGCASTGPKAPTSPPSKW
jgi:hypothetical protein